MVYLSVGLLPSTVLTIFNFALCVLLLFIVLIYLLINNVTKDGWNWQLLSCYNNEEVTNI